MRDGFEWISVNSREYLVCAPLAARARHLFSTRQLELPSDFEQRRRNIAQFAIDLGVEPARLQRVRQVHGSHVLVEHDEQRHEPGSIDADAVVTSVSGSACAVQIADCVPILIAAGGAVAAIHAGWRGTAAGVTRAAIGALVQGGADPSTMVAAVGPSISACCYQVDAKVRDAFAASSVAGAAADAFTADGEAHWRLDVAAINRAILIAAGIPAGQIYMSGLCTACDLGRFYSYRSEGKGTGRLIAGIVVPSSGAQAVQAAQA